MYLVIYVYADYVHHTEQSRRVSACSYLSSKRESGLEDGRHVDESQHILWRVAHALYARVAGTDAVWLGFCDADSDEHASPRQTVGPDVVVIISVPAGYDVMQLGGSYCCLGTAVGYLQWKTVIDNYNILMGEDASFWFVNCV